MKRKVKIFAALVFCALFALSNSILVSACTAVYVGSEASEDGTILLAKSNDYQDVWGNYVAITERVGNEPGRTMQVDNGATVFAPLPADMSCVTWESTGPALYGVFVPVSNGAQSISEPYSRNQSAENARTFDTQQYPYYRFKALCTLGVEKNDYTIYGLPVRTYWHDAESIMTQEMPEILKTAAGMDEAAAKQYITDYCNAMQDQAFTDAGQILNDVLWYRSRNSNTMKNGRNPETHEILDERAAVDPLKVSLDPAAYHFVPSMPDQH